LDKPLYIPQDDPQIALARNIADICTLPAPSKDGVNLKILSRPDLDVSNFDRLKEELLVLMPSDKPQVLTRGDLRELFDKVSTPAQKALRRISYDMAAVERAGFEPELDLIPEQGYSVNSSYYTYHGDPNSFIFGVYSGDVTQMLHSSRARCVNADNPEAMQPFYEPTQGAKPWAPRNGDLWLQVGEDLNGKPRVHRAPPAAGSRLTMSAFRHE
jgi:hypothetical protein